MVSQSSRAGCKSCLIIATSCSASQGKNVPESSAQNPRHVSTIIAKRVLTVADRLLVISCRIDVHLIATIKIYIHSPRCQVVVDSCVVGAPSAFLQQAAHLTGGVYLCPARPAGLLQYLLMVHSPLSWTCIASLDIFDLLSKFICF